MSLSEAVYKLQAAYNTAEEKVKKLEQYMTNVERIVKPSSKICSLPKVMDDYIEEVKDLQDKYEYLTSMECNDGLDMELKEKEISNLYDSVIRKISGCD